MHSPSDSSSQPNSNATLSKIEKLASTARTEAIVGVFFFGLILAPVALFRIRKAKRLIAEHNTGTHLTDSLATTRTIAWTAFVIWIIAITVRISMEMQST